MSQVARDKTNPQGKVLDLGWQASTIRCLVNERKALGDMQAVTEDLFDSEVELLCLFSQ
jgi:hypothetical protein